jgi:hypothetical protein
MRKAMWLMAVIATLAFSFVALAQQPTTGKLRGVVGDRDGKALPGATVIVTGPNGERGIQTDENGNFDMPFLSTGKYRKKKSTSPRSRSSMPSAPRSLRHSLRKRLSKRCRSDATSPT